LTSGVYFTIGGMKKSLISSLGNPLVKKARSLRQKKGRRESGLFLIEGIHHVGEAISAGWDVEDILYSPDQLTSQFAHKLIDGYKFKPQPVTPQVMESLSEKENPQGILAIAHQREYKYGELRSIQRGVALVSPQDPGNVGTILRTIDAVGADVLFILDGGVELYHPSLVRASMGAIFWKPVIASSFQKFIEWTNENRISVIGSSARGERPGDVTDRWVLLLGNEQKGLSESHLNACRQVITLPMKGKVSSLNLSVAAGILLYSLMEK